MHVFSSFGVVHLICLCFESVVCERLSGKVLFQMIQLHFFRGAFASSLSHFLVLRKM